MYNKNVSHSRSYASEEDEDAINENIYEEIKGFNYTPMLLSLINMFVFAFGLTLFVVGLLYLTVYRYEYSFTVFSIDMMGGIFVACGAILAFYSLISVFLIKPFAQPQLAILYAFVVFILCLLLFLLGIIGLSMNNGEFGNQIKNNIESTGYIYSLNDPFRHATLKMNWLQTRFKCCECVKNYKINLFF
jgi:amino acid transporter